MKIKPFLYIRGVSFTRKYFETFRYMCVTLWSKTRTSPGAICDTRTKHTMYSTDTWWDKQKVINNTCAPTWLLGSRLPIDKQVSFKDFENAWCHSNKGTIWRSYPSVLLLPSCKSYFCCVKKSWLHKWHALWVWLTNCVVIFQIISLNIFWCNLMLTFSSRWASFFVTGIFQCHDKDLAKWFTTVYVLSIVLFNREIYPVHTHGYECDKCSVEVQFYGTLTSKHGSWFVCFLPHF